jgi:hypothetical protein
MTNINIYIEDDTKKSLGYKTIMFLQFHCKEQLKLFLKEYKALNPTAIVKEFNRDIIPQKYLLN